MVALLVFEIMDVINESLFLREKPWAACAAMEAFLDGGGQCRSFGELNWTLIISYCDGKATDFETTFRSVAERFGWAHLCILIRQSLTETSSSPERYSSQQLGSMWIRANMIGQFGHVPGDPICDISIVSDWAFSIPQIKELLQSDNPEKLPFDSMIVAIAELFRFLIKSGKLDEAGDVAAVLAKSQLVKLRIGQISN